MRSELKKKISDTQSQLFSRVPCLFGNWHKSYVFFVKNEEVRDKKKKYTGHITINIYIEYKMYLQLPYVADNTFFMVSSCINDGYAHEKHISI